MLKAVLLALGAIAAWVARSSPASADDIVPALPVAVPAVVAKLVAVPIEPDVSVPVPPPGLREVGLAAASEKGAGPVVEGMDSEATGPADHMPVPLAAVPAAGPGGEGNVPLPVPASITPVAPPPPGSDTPLRSGGCSHTELGTEVGAVVASAPSSAGATTARAIAA